MRQRTRFSSPLTNAPPEAGRVTADVAQAAAIALGALPNLLKLRADFKAFADSDKFLKGLDRLQDYAMAAFYAHLRATPSATEKEVLQLLEEGKPIRENHAHHG